MFQERVSIEEVEEGTGLAPKFDTKWFNTSCHFRCRIWRALDAWLYESRGT